MTRINTATHQNNLISSARQKPMMRQKSVDKNSKKEQLWVLSPKKGMILPPHLPLYVKSILTAWYNMSKDNKPRPRRNPLFIWTTLSG